jgi:hypothetical protein
MMLKVPFPWPPSVEMIGRNWAEVKAKGLQFQWAQHAPASHAKACKQCGCLIRWHDPSDILGERAATCAQCTIWKAGHFEKLSDLDKLKAIMIPEALELLRKNHAAQELRNKYRAMFGGSFIPSDEVHQLMALSLETGVDQLVDEKCRQKEMREERAREHERFLAAPITEEMVSHYTSLIRRRKLYEGACDLSWEKYFEYLTTHPNIKLSPKDLSYAAQWTSCAAR